MMNGALPPIHSSQHDHRHGHDHSGRHAHDHGAHHHEHTSSERRLILALVLTAGFMVLELAGGLLAHSMALVADAGHMLTDSAALAMAWAALHFARRPADVRRSFGYQRLQVLAAFVNGVTLFAIVAWIAFESIQRLLAPTIVNSRLMLIVACVGAAVNLFVFALLRSEPDHNLNVAAAVVHVLGDLLGSVAAIAAAIVILLIGWMPIDPILSLCVCALIVRSALAVVRKSAHILMEGAPDWLDVGELRTQLKTAIPAIQDIHHVHCWSLAPKHTLLTMHVIVAAGADHAAVLSATNQMLAARFGIDHATIQLDSGDCKDVECEGTKG